MKSSIFLVSLVVLLLIDSLDCESAATSKVKLRRRIFLKNKHRSKLSPRNNVVNKTRVYDNSTSHPLKIITDLSIPDSVYVLKKNKFKYIEGAIHIATTICGTKYYADESMILINSAILMSSTPVYFHIFVETETKQQLISHFSKWPNEIKDRINVLFYDTWFPKKHADWWHNIYQRCVTQKIFVPSLIKGVDQLLFLDIDVAVVTKLETIWARFNEFNESHAMGAAYDAPFKDSAYASHIRRGFPIYGRFGLNGGVLFMKLKKLREMKFEKQIMQLLNNYKFKLTYAEQDLMAILFSYHADKFKLFSYSVNFHPFYCQFLDKLMLPGESIQIYHGVAGTFKLEKTFNNKLYSLLFNVDFYQNDRGKILEDFAEQLENSFDDEYPDYMSCFNVRKIVAKGLREAIPDSVLPSYKHSSSTDKVDPNENNANIDEKKDEISDEIKDSGYFGNSEFD